MSIEARVLDPNAIRKAEEARMINEYRRAIEIAKAGLGLDVSPLTSEEISFIASDPNRTIVLASLARIYVSSVIGETNRNMWPPKVLSYLEESIRMIDLVYRNPDLITILENINQNTQEIHQNFLPEMHRDIAKTLLAAQVLYGFSDQADQIIIGGENILQQTYDNLSDGHQTKPLIGIEMQLIRALRGQQINTEQVMRDFNQLREYDEENNPHRVATVASWLIAWGRKINHQQMEEIGLQTFNRIIKNHPEWNFMIEKELKKIRIREIKRIIFAILTPITTATKRRRKLFDNLLNTINTQSA